MVSLNREKGGAIVRNRRSTMFYPMLLALLSIATILPALSSVLAIDQISGAIWTTDSKGQRVNGNLFTNPRNVFLTGGPFKIGALGLPDAIYYFQVTDPAGEVVLSADVLQNRMFKVEGGCISEVFGVDGGHNWKPSSRGGVIVQLWEFDYIQKQGGEYKVWVTRVDDYSAGEGCFGFVPSMSKTDNFKVRVDEAVKRFELWVTEGINEIPNVAFYVDYGIDEDGDLGTKDDVLWTSGQLFQTDESPTIYRYETTFADGTYIYWEFSAVDTETGDILWSSGERGPEQITVPDEGEMLLNKEVLFRINGTKFGANDEGLPGWIITLKKDGEVVRETETDCYGYYEFIAAIPGDYRISCQGWTTDESSETWHDYGAFEISDSVDQTFDFYDYQILGISNLMGAETELFDVVFTPSNEGDDRYKLSSTNPGSFHLDVNLEHQDPGKAVQIEISLPPAGTNAPYDWPNFILQHAFVGGTPTVDVQVYSDNTMTFDITEQFNITAADEKHVTIFGVVPDSGAIFVKVHIDYQIAGSLTLPEVEAFSAVPFVYTFTIEVFASDFGAHKDFGVHRAY